LYGLDVIILLSYDQVQFTDEGMLTLSYWTIIGAYMVSGEKIETKTVMEAAVYDIANRRLLFRASGEGRIKGSSTPVNLSEQLREESAKGFQMVATRLAANLASEAEVFKKQMAMDIGEYKTERKAGYTGGPFGEP
jgi:rhombotail lipoprotein